MKKSLIYFILTIVIIILSYIALIIYNKKNIPRCNDNIIKSKIEKLLSKEMDNRGIKYKLLGIYDGGSSKTEDNIVNKMCYIKIDILNQSKKKRNSIFSSGYSYIIRYKFDSELLPYIIPHRIIKNEKLILNNN